MDAVELLRVKAGTTETVRILSDVGLRVLGCNTHWYEGRSRYCAADCAGKVHAQPSVWKGFLAVQLRDSTRGVWRAAVLEVTEQLEQSFRGEVQRGQEWRLFRALPTRENKRPPLEGKLIARHDPQLLIPGFPVVTVVAAKMHVRPEILCLDTPCPLPDRLYIADEPFPDAPAPACPVKPNEEERKAALDSFRRGAANFARMPHDV